MAGLSLEMWQGGPVYGPEAGERLTGVVMAHVSVAEGPWHGLDHEPELRARLLRFVGAAV